MSYSDAPIPASPEAQFAVWRKYVDEQIARLVRPKTSKFVIGPLTITTDASGFLTFNHDLESIPTAIFIQVTGVTESDIWPTRVDELTETTARVRFLDSTSGSVVSAVSKPVTFWAWVVYSAS